MTTVSQDRGLQFQPEDDIVPVAALGFPSPHLLSVSHSAETVYVGMTAVNITHISVK